MQTQIQTTQSGNVPDSIILSKGQIEKIEQAWLKLGFKISDRRESHGTYHFEDDNGNPVAYLSGNKICPLKLGDYFSELREITRTV